MARILLGIALVLCVACGRVTPEDADHKFALISVSAMAANHSGTLVNSPRPIQGVFGLTSLTGPVTGELVHVETTPGVHHGCTEYSHDVDLPAGPWVALVERGSCVFPVKVGLATKNYSAAAVIVYDNKVNPHLTVMNTDYTDEVYVFVNQADGRQLARQVDNGSQVRVTIMLIELSSSPYLHPLVTSPALGALMALLGVNLAFRQYV